MLRSRMEMDRVHSPFFEDAREWSGHVGFDFLGRLLMVLGLIAPPLTILAAVAYYATHL
ncbi:MAG: hypothetical protein ACR2IE_08105 [Candidatus Sumerlaeaceae bacterium]